ncbi:MAG: Tex family protein [Phycisphaerae bacterium]
MAVDTHLNKVAGELNLKLSQVAATAKLLEEGGTVPFIARYRKEATGTLDEVAITSIRDRLEQLAELDARRKSILDSLEERKILTDALRTAVDGAETLAALEDIYLPYRPKKRTRATIAKEAGLEPLAEAIYADQEKSDPAALAAGYINQEKGIETTDAALAGARDIIAEKINDHAETRAALRELFAEKGILKSEVAMGKEEEGAKYKDYFKWEEPIKTAPSHRILAVRRGAEEGILYFRIQPPEEEAVAIVEQLHVKGRGEGSEQVKLAAKDAYKRLLSMSMETEIRLGSKKRADEEAIRVFAENLRELLLASPLGQKRMLAIDPGFRTGCKTVVLDAQGKLLHNDVIYPDQGQHKTAEAEHTVRMLVEKYQIEAVAIGNGTAGRETETFVRKLGLPASVQIVMVNESGASIYSASEVARDEFPDLDLTVRGAVSIGRRLMDPLAELVKIDPKSIGDGQYQHDVDQENLKKSLDDTVISCVNAVGVDLNTASKQLLTYVSGLNATIAENIVKHRNEKGAFKSRKDLGEVPRLGPKTFEQSAGFLRIRGSENPLDGSAVHPESYGIVERMAKDLGATVADLMRDPALRAKIDKQKYVTDKVGLPTLTDILNELAKPGRDPRATFEAFSFAEGLSKIEDVQPGMRVPGIITNVTAFGAFCDIGVHQDGLIHISQLADRFVKSPADVVKVQQRVMVTVLEVDVPRKRISLTMKQNAGGAKPEVREQKAGEVRRPQSRKPVAAAPAEGWFSAALKNARK